MYSKLLRLLFVGLSVQSSLGAVVGDAAAAPPATVIATQQPPVTRNPSYTVVAPSSTRPTTTSSTKPTSTSTTSTRPVQTPPTSSIKTSSSTRTTTQPTFTQSDPILDGPRETNVLADIKGFYGLPGRDDVIRNATLNATDIQGDILVGMRKKLELFYFFHINEAQSFKKKLHVNVVPRITSTLDLLNVVTQPVVCLNIAFTYTGLKTLGFTSNLADNVWFKGQEADAWNLGDPSTTNWVPEFTGRKIDGVFLIASDTMTNVIAMKNWLETLFGTDITKIYELQGNIRPPPFEGHEMFGYLDGVGQPAVAGFNVSPVPGQQVINAGVILVGEPGDTLIGSRPSWAKDGSFLVFRQLKQLVPEFDKYCLDNAPPQSSWTLQQRAELLGARIIGRWKSGAPVDLSPTVDNPALAADPNQNNNFDFSHTGFNIATNQKHCPFAAHIRKSRPRADLATPLNAIMRAGIPYGPEPSSTEYARNTSSTDIKMERGLAFVSYQSRIDAGFKFIQEAWANTVNFAPGKSPQPGFDLIFGQNHGGPRWMSGADINNPNAVLNMLTEFVISRGGEYFFAPSITAIRDVISV
ncbi:hypothetical protein FRC17_006239 [Serendipita sp. 399]|nr:hypothetical protein FRC17_006239 [Serendipita sp. 399]